MQNEQLFLSQQAITFPSSFVIERIHMIRDEHEGELSLHRTDFYAASCLLNHIGIACENLEKALSFYCGTLGLPLVFQETIPSQQIQVAFLALGNTQIELLAPLNEKAQLTRFLQKQGSRLHHIALEVPNLNEKMATYKAKGIRFIYEQPILGAARKAVTFIHPHEAHGVLIEFCDALKGNDK